MNVSYPNQPMFRGCETRNTERTLGVNLIQPSAPDLTYEDDHREYSEENVMGTLQGFPSVCHERGMGYDSGHQKGSRIIKFGKHQRVFKQLSLWQISESFICKWVLHHSKGWLWYPVFTSIFHYFKRPHHGQLLLWETPSWKCYLNLSWTHFCLQSGHILGQEIPCVLQSKMFLICIFQPSFYNPAWDILHI